VIPAARWAFGSSNPDKSGAAGFVLALLASVALAILFDGWLARGDWVMKSDYYNWILTSSAEFDTIPFFHYRPGHLQKLVTNPDLPLLGTPVWQVPFLPADTHVRILIVP
jgi:hypothetical protein